MKYLIVISSIYAVMLGLPQSMFADTKSNVLPLQGRSLATLTEDYFVVQTDKFFYKIARNGLAPDLSLKLEKGVINNQHLAFNIPQEKIEYVWPVVFWESTKQPENINELNKNELDTNKLENAGKVQLTGVLALSFSAEYYLIQSGYTVYQLKKSSLSQEQLSALKQVGIGEQISIAIPKSSINYSWNFKQVVSRNIASVTPRAELDEMSLNETYLTLKGTVLHSASESTVIVQSKDLIYHLKRNGVLTKTPKLLATNGARIQLMVPVNAIEFFWPVNNTKVVKK